MNPYKIFVNKYFHLFPVIFSIGMGISPQTAVAQEPDNRPCVKAFERAQADYQNGRVFKVLELENCLSDLPAYLKGSAYYLLFKSYVLVSNDSMANYSMQRLLQETPEIDPKVEDEKFRYFYQQFEPRISEIGLFVGQNLHAPAIEAGAFGPGLSIGLVYQRQIKDRWYWFNNLIYSDRAQFFDAPTGERLMPGTLAGQDYISQQTADFFDVNREDYPTYTYHVAGSSFPSFVEGATGVNWIFYTQNRFEIFLSAGLAVNYLLEKEFDEGLVYFTHYEYQISSTNPNNPYEFTKIPIVEEPTEIAYAEEAEHQTKLNVHYLGGMGLRYQMGKGVLFFETRYQRSIVPQKMRFIDPTGIFEQALSPYQWGGLEFQTQTLTFSVGYSLKLQRFKNMRK